jgi:class 3 adenylate cyclase
MDLLDEIEVVRTSLGRAEHIQLELDRRVFHLKTLYDVSKDIFSSVESETILKTFLMMTMGNFGVIDGFLLSMDIPCNDISHFVTMGFHDLDEATLRLGGRAHLLQQALKGPMESILVSTNHDFLPEAVVFSLMFAVEPGYWGLLGLGPKIVGEPYHEDDRELLMTLVNNLTVALRHARSFEKINSLNEDLQDRNVRLEDALGRLQAAMRKVEILESVKASLSKFVPNTVCRMIEDSPANDILESKEQDLSILFLDIEGYTKICERFENVELNRMVEKYFSAVMDAIYANNGDVNETAGDGLMVLFVDGNEETNALEAVRTALSIRDKVACIQEECKEFFEPLLINIGVNSGTALVGAAKFESYTGSRWTYTARGLTTNVAARIGALATGGQVLLSRTTADRVRAHVPVEPLGRFKLKNVSEEVEVFAV